MFRRTREFFASKKLDARSKVAEDVLFGKAAISGDAEIATSIAQLTEAMCKNNCPGVFDGLSFLFVKIRDNSGEFRIAAKRLTVEDRLLLDENKELLLDAEKVAELLKLQHISDQPNNSSALT